MSANEVQVGGVHYKTAPIQPWDFIAANKLGFFEGNVIKYVSRHHVKAQHYLEKLIEMELAKPASNESNTVTPKRRGRPKKVASNTVTQKRRGRPPKNQGK
jgi:hypothetical protein